MRVKFGQTCEGTGKSPLSTEVPAAMGKGRFSVGNKEGVRIGKVEGRRRRKQRRKRKKQRKERRCEEEERRKKMRCKDLKNWNCSANSKGESGLFTRPTAQ